MRILKTLDTNIFVSLFKKPHPHGCSGHQGDHLPFAWMRFKDTQQDQKSLIKIKELRVKKLKTFSLIKGRCLPFIKVSFRSYMFKSFSSGDFLFVFVVSPCFLLSHSMFAVCTPVYLLLSMHLLRLHIETLSSLYVCTFVQKKMLIFAVLVQDLFV